MKKLIEIEHIGAIKNRLILQWNFGNTCNWDCSYCSPYVKDGSQKWPTIDMVKKVINNVKDHANKIGKTVEVVLSGGEITLAPHIFEVFDLFIKNNFKLSFISNGSRTIKWWNRLYQKENIKFESITFSYHIEFTDFKHFANVIHLTENKNVTKLIVVTMQMLAKSNIFEKQIKVYNELKQKCPNILIIPLAPMLHEDFRKNNLSNEQKNWIENNIHNSHLRDNHRNIIAKYIYNNEMMEEPADFRKIFLNNDNSFQGWECNIGLDRIFINMKKKVFCAQCKVGGLIGKIDDDKPLNFPEKPTICPRKFCYYQSNVLISKKKNDKN